MSVTFRTGMSVSALMNALRTGMSIFSVKILCKSFQKILRSDFGRTDDLLSRITQLKIVFYEESCCFEKIIDGIAACIFAIRKKPSGSLV